MTVLRKAWLILPLTVVAITLGACGGGDDEGTTEAATETTTTETTEAAGGAGRQLFVDGCGGCHTLEAAGTTGTLGPDLDEFAPYQKEEVLDVMAKGAGPMPPDIYTGQQAEQVAEYVSAVAGS